MLATEAMMRALVRLGGLARHFGQDEELWGLTGLLHDIDYEETDSATHALVASSWLLARGVDPRIAYAIKVHNERHGEPRLSLMDKALFAVEPLAGLITAAALVRPEKRLATVELKSLQKRFGERAFARGVRREDIDTCSELGLTREEFMALGLAAMQSIADQLGL